METVELYSSDIRVIYKGCADKVPRAITGCRRLCLLTPFSSCSRPDLVDIMKRAASSQSVIRFESDGRVMFQGAEVADLNVY